MPVFNDILSAQDRIRDKAIKTPLLSSALLNKAVGKDIYVKAECLQKTGSFKFRGAWSAISALSETDRTRGVIAFSSGNHAQGIAAAAQAHNIPALIVMPSDAPAIKIDNTKALGAEVVTYDRETEDRDAAAATVNKDRNMTLIKPFDNHHVIAGQGTVGLEIATQTGKLDIRNARVLVPCGGAGLTSGIALALNEKAPNFMVHPCEPQGFDDVARSLNSGQIEKNAHMLGSICDAIITPSPGELTFPILREHCTTGLVVSDDECLHAMALAFEYLKIVVEPGGATALAAAFFHSDAFSDKPIIAVASGGNVDTEMFQQALAKYGKPA